jgi:hypothetical protein
LQIANLLLCCLIQNCRFSWKNVQEKK